VADLPLRFTLEPILPQRTPARADERVFEYGFHLRMPDGLLVAPDDPLLDALGAEVVTVSASSAHGEALQGESVGPGRSLATVIEPPDEDGDVMVGLWDREGTRCAGLLPWSTAGRVAAAMGQGLEVQALALSERRALLDDRRRSLEVLVSIAATVTVDHDTSLAVLRPQRETRRRVVLFADESGEVRWWDAAADAGPADVGDLPVSQELRRELKKLRKAYSKLEEEQDEPLNGFRMMETDLQRAALSERGIRIWRRARRELAREFVVGYLGPGMETPAWSPGELTDDSDGEDGICF
jgi:hypothetical protein